MKKKENIIWKIILKYSPLYIAGIIFLIIFNYLDTFTSLFVGQVIAILSKGKDVLPNFLLKFINRSSAFKAVISVSFILLVVGIIRIVARMISYYSKNIFSHILNEKIGTEYYKHTIQLPSSFLSNHSTGDMIQRCTGDCNTFAFFFSDNLFNILDAVIRTLVYLIQIFLLSKILFLFGFASTFIIIGFAFFFALVILRKREEKMAELYDKLDSKTQQSFTNISLVKSFANEKEEENKFNGINKEKEGFALSLEKTYQRYWLVVSIYQSVFNLVCILIVGHFYIKGNLDLGMATTAIMLSSNLLSRASNLVNNLNKVIKFNVSYKRLEEYFKESDEYLNNGTLKPSFAGDIVYENVSMGYYKNHQILHNINLRIKQNETIGIIGRSGSGKSTLVNLLVKLEDFDSGDIKINGVSIKDIDKRYLRENISFVNQQAFLFAKTVKENITLLSNNNDYVNYVKMVDLDKDIEKFENGYETMVGERGVTLSGGQRQRVSIIRSLMKNKSILVLDDSLSAVDNKISAEIKKNLKKIKATTIIISHNLMNVMDADKIIVMDEGRIIEEGTHEELLKKKGQYAHIWNLQQQLEEVSSYE